MKIAEDILSLRHGRRRKMKKKKLKLSHRKEPLFSWMHHTTVKQPLPDSSSKRLTEFRSSLVFGSRHWSWSRPSASTFVDHIFHSSRCSHLHKLPVELSWSFWISFRFVHFFFVFVIRRRPAIGFFVNFSLFLGFQSFFLSSYSMLFEHCKKRKKM